MKLNDYFDNIYIINLEHRTDRWQHCKQQMAKHGFTAEKFKAINRSELINGWQACTLSHIAVLEDARQRGFQRVLVLEDDFVLHNDFMSGFFLPINQDIYWQILYLGINNHLEPEIVSPFMYGGRIRKIIKGLTSHAVAYSNVQLLDEFINLCKELKTVIDVYQYEYFQRDKQTAYCFYPNLAWQLGGFSDIEQRDMYYEHLKP
jgi:hypothetical protein